MTLLLALLSLQAPAQDILFNEVVQGGVSVDGSGVSVPASKFGTSEFTGGDDLIVFIPAGATIDKLYLIVTSKWGVSQQASGEASGAIFGFVNNQILTAVTGD